MIIQTRTEERTGFQENAAYDPSIDLQTDFVMVYGIDKTTVDRIKAWKRQGYIVHLMTGIAWGEYQDYLYGKFDGREHWDEAQRNREGEIIGHGVDVPYMVPTVAFANYLTEKIKVAVDAGVEAIHLEEPEFWVKSGYSEAFKREWEIYYNEQWIPPHRSVDARYRASKLKAYLYTRCLDRCCTALKEYAQVKYGRKLRFYVPTHSLINYTQWRIVSPQSQLLDLPTVDGYIAQVWTGTARTPNIYHGIKKERTFETAYLEYGVMQELARGTGREMWFLHDPIEDNANYHWEDYQYNYYKTVVASLFHSDVSKYEVSPWPNRIFNQDYPTKDRKGKESIPAHYATSLLIVLHTLRDLEQDDIAWENGMNPIGILLSDTTMYQRNIEDNVSDRAFAYDTEEEWSGFYGLALPLLKSGVPVRPILLDNIRRFPSYFDAYQTMVLSYEIMKPKAPDIHLGLSQWIHNGGNLIYVGDQSDPYHEVREWWNEQETKYNSPVEHLFDILGLDPSPAQGTYKIGQGSITILPIHPGENARNLEYARSYKLMVKDAVTSRQEDAQVDWHEKNYLLMRRGPYVIASVLEESLNEEPLQINGLYVNLFDHELPICEQVTVKPDEQILLYDLNVEKSEEPFQIIASASRIEEMKIINHGVKLLARGPAGVKGITRMRCLGKPTKVQVLNNTNKYEEIEFKWDERSHTVVFHYDNAPNGVEIEVLRNNSATVV